MRISIVSGRRSDVRPVAVQYKWESEQSNSYSIKEDSTEMIEGSGTRIVLHLKEDSEEYLDDFKVCFLPSGVCFVFAIAPGTAKLPLLFWVSFIVEYLGILFETW